MVNKEKESINKDYCKLLLQQMIQISSITNNKYYIPGETKEIE